MANSRQEVEPKCDGVKNATDLTTKSQQHELGRPQGGVDSDVTRQTILQDLIRRYILQLRYGCNSPECTTVHCYGAKRLNAMAPVRRPNPFTARMQAIALATGPDPNGALCPHPPLHRLDDYGKLEPSNLFERPSPSMRSEASSHLKDDKSLVQSLLSQEGLLDFEPTYDHNPGGILMDDEGVLFTGDLPPFEKLANLREWKKVAGMCRIPIAKSEKGWGSRYRLECLRSFNYMQKAFERWSFHRRLIFDNIWHAISVLFPKPLGKGPQPPEFCSAKAFRDHHLQVPNDAIIRIIVVTFVVLDCYGEEKLLYPPASRLMDKLCRGIAALRGLHEVSELLYGSNTDVGWAVPRSAEAERSFGASKFTLLRDVFAILAFAQLRSRPDVAIADDAPLFINTQMEAFIAAHWDGELVVSRWEGVGAALEINKDLYEFITRYTVRNQWRNVPLWRTTNKPPIDVDNLNPKISLSFAEHKRDPNKRHLLEFDFLFPTTFLSHFRAINYVKMFSAYRAGGFMDHMSNRLHRLLLPTVPLWLRIEHGAANSRFLFLDLRRDHMLEDAFNQLRGRERRELLRPLKTRLGVADGMEIGVDQGGVTQEFFRLVFQKAFDDDYGMFVTDEITKLSWFRPGSPVELYKFELVGLLFSLAVYNGAMVTAHLPLALYRRFVIGETSLRPVDLRDDWPTISRSIEQMITWDEARGKFEDVFGLEFSFTNDDSAVLLRVLDEDLAEKGYGDTEGVEPKTSFADMKSIQSVVIQCPTQNPDHAHIAESKDGEAVAVTQRNKHEYMQDYIYWLTYASVKPQLEAFFRGFRRLLDEQAISILSPAKLQKLVEGANDLDINKLHAHSKTRNWERGKSNPRVVAFWAMVKSWPPDRQRLLLKFVTASERVSAMGYQSVAFILERNGGDSDLLPSCSTCFGLLMMPEYSSVEKMEKKLLLALENCEGFGVP